MSTKNGNFTRWNFHVAVNFHQFCIRHCKAQINYNLQFSAWTEYKIDKLTTMMH